MPRTLSTARFNEAYEKTVLDNQFFEGGPYYVTYKGRYLRSLREICRHTPDTPIDVLEIGGGMLALTMAEIFRDRVTVADLSAYPSENITNHGARHLECDLLRDRWAGPPMFNMLILAEVVEHLPVPLYTVFDRVLPCLRPGGTVFITTPNFHRIRNALHILAGKDVFNPLFFPERGKGMGHPFELQKKHLQYHLERAGCENIDVSYRQLSFGASTPIRRAGRLVASLAFGIVPRWRDNLVATATIPDDADRDTKDTDQTGRFEPDPAWVAVTQ